MIKETDVFIEARKKAIDYEPVIINKNEDDRLKIPIQNLVRRRVDVALNHVKENTDLLVKMMMEINNEEKDEEIKQLIQELGLWRKELKLKKGEAPNLNNIQREAIRESISMLNSKELNELEEKFKNWCEAFNQEDTSSNALYWYSAMSKQMLHVELLKE